MKSCTFFGHRDTPEDVRGKLYTVLDELITKENVNIFYVGYQGAFDKMVWQTLRLLKIDHPHINYYLVLTYPSYAADEFPEEECTVFPGILENVPKKFTIDRRNRWMVNNSDYAVCYVKYDFSCSYKYMSLAEKKKKVVINLAGAVQ